MTIDTLSSRLAHLGLVRTLGHYAASGLAEATGVDVFHVLVLEPPDVQDDGPVPAGVVVDRVGPESFRREMSREGWGLSPAAVEAEIAKGDACYGALADGRLVSYLFVAREATALDSRLVIRFDPSWAFSRWAFTHPASRGQHLHALVKRLAVRDQAATGRRGLISLVPAPNAESLRAGLRLGCRKASTVAVLRTPDRARVWHGRRCADFGLSLAVAAPRPH
ncbi:MAG TPA: hypothetical protein PLL32_01390 [Anaeromyxobacteraceae bacterium]|nr:hypothetical protein [Anaeromyxobacteraceae bacterium]